jgi:flagellar biosynthesis regulator FlbT
MRVECYYREECLVIEPTEWCISREDSDEFFNRSLTAVMKNISRFNVVLDLCRVELISIDAVESILELRWLLAREGRLLSLQNTRPAVREMLCGLTANDLLSDRTRQASAVGHNSHVH